MVKIKLLLITFILLLQIMACASEEPDFVSRSKETKETLKIKNRVATHSIKYSYPELTGYKDRALEDKFNKYVSSAVIKEVEDFKKDIKSSEKDLLESDFNGELQSYFNIEYTVINRVNNLISIKFLTEVYYAGAAHPCHEIWTVNYSLKSGKILKLGDLFKKDTNYLKVISDYSIKELSERAKKDGKEQGYEPDLNWIKEGASQKEENFASFNLKEKELIINFNEYQVDCYAAGPKEVVIPFDVLKDIINFDGLPGK